MENKKGTITEIIYYNESNGFTIAIMETESELLTIKGNLPSAEIGSCYSLIGDFTVHPQYGEQFAFKQAESVLPSGNDAIIAFLSSGVISGIRAKTARTIVGHFGEKTFEIMGENPDKLMEIPGIGKKTAAKIGKSFATHRAFAEVAVFFQDYGISSAQIMPLYKKYKSDTITVVKENPYRIVEEVRGVGFNKADRIALNMGFEIDDTRRIECGIKHTLLYSMSDGNTCCKESVLCEESAMLLEVSGELIVEHLRYMIYEGVLRLAEINGINFIYFAAYYEAERKVAGNIWKLANSEIKKIGADVETIGSVSESKFGISLSGEQSEAVKRSVLSGVSVITGGPGTGKTTIIGTLIEIFDRAGMKIALAAPTGRAAKRITETSGREARTIHRMLEYEYSDSQTFMVFGRNEENTIEADVIIVDEASMIDIMLMEGLTDAVSMGSRLILVGDADQLPSVGPGNVLRDIIDSGVVSVSALTEIYRQAQESMIVVNAHRINHGEIPVANGVDTDFFFMERRSSESLQSLVVELVSKRLPQYYDIENPIEDIQVLTPIHKGNTGTLALNEVIQNVVNPADSEKNEKKMGRIVYREGDKIMQLKNDYELEWHYAGNEERHRGVYNGDMGRIVSINKEDATLTAIFDGDRYVDYNFGMLDEIALAYAITVHKSQGSEFPVVILPLYSIPPMLATRNLLYTAVTRGRKLVIIAGDERVLRSMVENDRIGKRLSGLDYFLGQMQVFTKMAEEGDID